MTYEPEYELRKFGRWRVSRVLSLASEGSADMIHGSLLLAIGSRESNLRNVVSYDGHDRGWLQISDRYHADWLAKVRGCEEGSWEPIYESALMPGLVPPLGHAALKAISILRGSHQYLAGFGVPEPEVVPPMIAAYNCGSGNALRAWKEKSVDRYTTNQNYSSDVLMRQRAIRSQLRDFGWTDGLTRPRTNP